ncbi:MAG: signal peptide peptidase SppA [Thiohalocapsa sp.]
MRRLVVGLFAAIGLVAALMVIGVGVVVWRLAAATPSVPERVVLQVDLSRGLAAGASADPLSEVVFGGGKMTLRSFLDALERGAADPRVKGLFARVGGDSLGLGVTQEVRDAIREFRAKGKFAIAFADSFGEFGPGTRPYYLATAFDEMWLQPLGSLGLIGLHSEQTFFRGALDKLGVVPSFAHREEYKTATNTLTETAMTPAQREEVEDLVNASERQIVHGIAEARKLGEEEVRALIDRGPWIAHEALHAHLVDQVGYRDQAIDKARAKAGAGAKFMSLKHYLDAAGKPHQEGPKIALIYANGLIATGDSTSSPLLGESGVTARKLARGFRQAAADKEVRAILFRIDSPGGSAVASETIWREVVRAKEHGKPVIVSMGDVAGSGGYYIAAPADKIVAEPGTLTGSIGILAGKVVVGDLMKKLGITSESVQRGANAGMFSVFEDFSASGTERLNTFLDDIYRGFKERVANGRHLSADQVEAAAKGRVWSGEEAKANGLVDELGGYAMAIRLAKAAAKIAPDAAFKLTVYPHERGIIEKVYDRLTGQDEDSDTAIPSAAQSLLGQTAALLSDAMALVGERGLLRMPPLGEIR